MRQLGCKWHFQTVGAVERGARPLSEYEVSALGLALMTTRDVLALPPPNVALVRFGEQQIPAQRLSIIDDSVSWDGDDIKVTPPTVQYRGIELRLAKEQDAQTRAAIEAYRWELRRAPGEGADDDHEEAPAGESQALDIPVRRLAESED